MKLGNRELNMLKNYDYQQNHVETGKADILYQLEEWKEAGKSARSELHQLKMRKNVEQMGYY